MIKKRHILIVADTNDGDYVTKFTRITVAQIKLIEPVIARIKENLGDYSTGELGDSAEELYGDMPDVDLFDSFVPNSELGINTIKSIEIYEVVGKEIYM